MNNQMTVIDALSLFDTDKKQRLDFAKQVVDNLDNGTADALKVHLLLKSMEDIIKTLTDKSDKNKNSDLAKKYNKLLLDTAQRHGKEFDYYNASFKEKEVGVKYDFSNCNDSQLADLERQKAELEAKIKERQNFLKTLPTNPFNYINEDTGEVEELWKPIKTSTTTLETKLK